MTREEAQAAYAEAEEQMNEAAAELRKYGIYAASPIELRMANASYLSRMANIARSGATDPAYDLEQWMRDNDVD